MRRCIDLAMVAFVVLLTGCGPDTIFVRPYLDTPEQHLAAGHKLLERGKYDDACREFIRARGLMAPNNVSVHVGLGLALGYKGEFDQGQKVFDQARDMAISDKDKAEVKRGYDQFESIRHNQDQDQKATPK